MANRRTETTHATDADLTGPPLRHAASAIRSLGKWCRETALVERAVNRRPQALQRHR